MTNARAYSRGANDAQESGIEKVAIYTLNGLPKHAARQLPSGAWSSKLGNHIDIEHSLEGLAGDLYGSVAHILSRPIGNVI